MIPGGARGMDGRMADVSGGAGFLLCRRAAGLNRHASQWALPGGRLDAGETAIRRGAPRARRGARRASRPERRARDARRLPDPFRLRHHAGRAVGRWSTRADGPIHGRCWRRTESASTSCAETTLRSSSTSRRAIARSCRYRSAAISSTPRREPCSCSSGGSPSRAATIRSPTSSSRCSPGADAARGGVSGRCGRSRRRDPRRRARRRPATPPPRHAARRAGRCGRRGAPHMPRADRC